jgi:hypothetical protein
MRDSQAYLISGWCSFVVDGVVTPSLFFTTVQSQEAAVELSIGAAHVMAIDAEAICTTLTRR